MRQITKDAVQAFFNNHNFKRDNTQVLSTGENTVELRLHGSTIAKKVNGIVSVSSCGHTTNTTKERLNGVLSRCNVSRIYQKAFVWYWKDGQEFGEGMQEV
jgi:hypothetical protein